MLLIFILNALMFMWVPFVFHWLLLLLKCGAQRMFIVVYCLSIMKTEGPLLASYRKIELIKIWFVGNDLKASLYEHERRAHCVFVAKIIN